MWYDSKNKPKIYNGNALSAIKLILLSKELLISVCPIVLQKSVNNITTIRCQNNVIVSKFESYIRNQPALNDLVRDLWLSKQNAEAYVKIEISCDSLSEQKQSNFLSYCKKIMKCFCKDVSNFINSLVKSTTTKNKYCCKKLKNEFEGSTSTSLKQKTIYSLSLKYKSKKIL